MSTPSSPSYIQDNQDFEKNFTSFQNDLNNYDDLVNQQGSLQSAYHSELSKVNWNGKNPWVLLITVMQLVLNPGTNMINNQIDQKGTESECQTSLLRCQDDLQKITTEKGVQPTGLMDEVNGLNKLIAELNGSQAAKVFGASGCANLNDNLLTLRHQIYVGNDPSCPNNGTWSQAYFDTIPTSAKMTSYGQMQENLSKQGDTLGANEANTQMTNAFGTNTSILQSVSAQTKEELTQWINVVKTLASAGSSFGHSISQVSSAAQQNMRPQ
ncbi:MAG TPA: hypothetical protein VLE96_05720 [Chlamydiales bacterium]|nr:hypothetical protein [Chlamydiales bacterium]